MKSRATDSDRALPRRALLGGLSGLGGLTVLGLLPARGARCAPGGFFAIDGIVDRTIATQGLAGAVVLVGHDGAIAFHRAYGLRALVPAREAMTEDTIFDMASLTKPTVTTVAVMQFYEQGRFGLDDPVARHLPAFAANGKQAVTMRNLLTHYSGLPPDLPLREAWTGRDAAVALAMASPLDNPPGTKFVYSDINFITLGLLVEQWSGLTLDRYAQTHILGPLGMTDSGFLPLTSFDAARIARIAPTQQVWQADGGPPVVLRGVVHDPTSRRMGGVAGHAGLFSDARDMAHYAQALLDRLAGRSSDFPLRRETLILMTRPQSPPGRTDLRGLGWDIDTHYSSNRGTVFPKGSFGHTGYTGTSLWLDPGSDSFVLVLTNRVHPDGGGHGIIALRRDIATAAALALGVRASHGAGLEAGR